MKRGWMMVLLQKICIFAAKLFVKPKSNLINVFFLCFAK